MSSRNVKVLTSNDLDAFGVWEERLVHASNVDVLSRTIARMPDREGHEVGGHMPRSGKMKFPAHGVCHVRIGRTLGSGRGSWRDCRVGRRVRCGSAAVGRAQHVSPSAVVQDLRLHQLNQSILYGEGHHFLGFGLSLPPLHSLGPQNSGHTLICLILFWAT